MKLKDLVLFLVLELLAIVVAGLAFSFLPSKVMAGAIAGGYFVVSGIFMLAKANHWPAKTRSLTWYVLFVHVFVISIPMLMSRFLQLSSAFEDVKIFGLSGPEFHNISTGVFSILIAATVIDGIRAWKSPVGREATHVKT